MILRFGQDNEWEILEKDNIRRGFFGIQQFGFFVPLFSNCIYNILFGSEQVKKCSDFLCQFNFLLLGGTTFFPYYDDFDSSQLCSRSSAGKV